MSLRTLFGPSQREIWQQLSEQIGASFSDGGFFSDLGVRLLGMQDIEIGNDAFDRAFVIKGNDAARLRRLFASEPLRDLMLCEPELRLTVKDDEGCFGRIFADNVDELLFTTTGVIKDIHRLKSLYEIFAATLDQLCAIGEAYERAPDTRL